MRGDKIVLLGLTWDRILHPLQHHEDGGTAVQEVTHPYVPQENEFYAKVCGLSAHGKDVAIDLEVEGVGKCEYVTSPEGYVDLKRHFGVEDGHFLEKSTVLVHTLPSYEAGKVKVDSISPVPKAQ